MTSAELKRDMLLFAKDNPKEFIDYANDPDIKLRNLAIRSIDSGVLAIKMIIELLFGTTKSTNCSYCEVWRKSYRRIIGIFQDR